MSKVFLLLFLVSTSISLAGTHPHGAEILFFKGIVQVKSSTSSFAGVEKGEVLIEGDTLKTGTGSFAILRFSDNSTLKIHPDSEFLIESLVEPVDDEILGSTNIFLNFGQVLIDVINTKEAPIFHIKTKSVAMGVRGTKFFAGIDKATGHTELAVNKGVVEISKHGQETHKEAIEAGHGIHVEKEGFTQPQRYDWVKDLDFNTMNKSTDVKKLQDLHVRKRAEFLKKRRAFNRDENKWNLHQKRWARSKKLHQQRSEKLKEKRKLFKKKREQFKLRRAELGEKRSALKEEARSLAKEAASFKRDEKGLRRKLSQFRTGRKDPRLKLQIAREKADLKKKKQLLQKKREAFREKRSKLNGEKKKLISEFKRNRVKSNLNRSKLNDFKKKNKRMKKRRRMKKRINQDAPNDSSTGGANSGNNL